MRQKNLLFCLIVLICMAAAFVVTLGYPSDARFSPIIVISLCGVVTLWELVNTYRQKDEKSPEPDKGYQRRFILTVAWVVAFVLIIWLLGFVIGLTLITFAYVKVHEKGWRWAIILPIITFLMSYVGFEILLQTPLYEGLLFL
ncbi:MAG: tripartite tricarboxylate transporter TctB family protein [Deltaproteobacteria bacterium]